MEATKLLLAEDDGLIASGLIYALETEGYAVTHCGTVKAAAEAVARQDFAASVLDLSLPDGSGFDILRALGGESPRVPVIFLTAADDEGNIVRALETGADDYITKPFRVRELLARLKAVLRRASNGSGDVLILGDVRIHTSSARVFAGGNEIFLPAQEYRLLLILAQNRGRILTRVQILDALWDSSGSFVNDNTLTVCVKRLREKLGGGCAIETVRGLGYRAEA